MSNQGAGHINLLSFKSKAAMLVLCPVVVIIVCSIVIYISAQGLVTEGSYNFDEPHPDYAFSQELDADEAYLTIQQLSQKLMSREIDVAVSNTVQIDKLVSDGNTAARQQLLQFVMSSAAGKIASLYPENGFTYGEEPELIESLSLFSESGGLSQTPVTQAALNEADARFEFTAVYDSVGILKSEDTAVKDEFLKSCDGMFTVKNAEYEMESAEIKIYTDLYEGKPGTVYFTRVYNVSAEIEFTDDYKELGTQNVSFVYTACKTLEIKWAGIYIEQDTITLHGNGYDTLSLQANVSPEAEDYTLGFVSSDESVLTVDENGQIEALKESTTPVTVTATLNYLGNTYVDSCTVYVINEVDGISLSKKKITLAAGETAVLTAKLDPEDATIQDIIWISENEDVAAVENGTVTGVSAGQTRIIAVSKDGHFMTACNVTVTEGEVKTDG